MDSSTLTFTFRINSPPSLRMGVRGPLVVQSGAGSNWPNGCSQKPGMFRAIYNSAVPSFWGAGGLAGRACWSSLPGGVDDSCARGYERHPQNRAHTLRSHRGRVHRASRRPPGAFGKGLGQAGARLAMF
jgi:hypothetical protein